MNKAQSDLVDLTKEILELTKQNNIMLKKISAYIDYVQSDKYHLTEEQKNLMTNLVANLLFGLRR